MKISFFDMLSEAHGGSREALEASFQGHELYFFDRPLPECDISLFKDSEIISVFVSSMVSKETIGKMSALKFINTSSTGYDHIDIVSANEKGALVSNVPAYGSNTVAEFAFALLLALSRKVAEANLKIKEKGDFDLAYLRGVDLFGKTLGVVGMGKIGKNVARIGKGFGMEVIAYDLYKDEAFAQNLGIKYVSLEEVLSSSDFITLHAPYTPENYHLINKESISKMKKGVFLINTARGELVDTEALLQGLNTGIIAGAGLDVLEEERNLKEEKNLANGKSLSGPEGTMSKIYKTMLEDHILMKMPNVIVTPHIAFYSKEAVNNIFNTTVQNIKGFIEGKPINLVLKT